MKMMNVVLASAASLLMTAVITPAQAAVMSVASANATAIDFSSIATGSYQTVTVGDYLFSQINGDLIYVFDGVSGRSLGDAYRGSQNNQGSVFNITRLDGAAFTIDSITFGLIGSGGRVSLGNYGINTTMLIGNMADGTEYSGSRNVLTNTASLFVDVFNFGQGGGVGLRGLSISSGAVTPAVPEPATWAMMLVGFGMIGGTARYRRRSVKASLA